MMVSHASRSARDGFTLLEMLVGLILLAIIAGMMVSAFKQIRPLRQIEEKYRAERVADILAEIVAKDISNTLMLSSSQTGRKKMLEGNSKQIDFSAVVKTGFMLEGLRDVRYAVKADPAGVLHLLRITSLRAGKPGSTVGRREDDLFTDVADFKLRYLKLEKAGKFRWQENWMNETQLPRAVRVDIVVKTGARRAQASRIAIFNSATKVEPPQPDPTTEKELQVNDQQGTETEKPTPQQ